MTTNDLAQSDPNLMPLADLWAAFERSGLPRRLFELARDEDLGPSATDPSADAAGADRWAGRVVVREEGVVAGLACVPVLLSVFGSGVDFVPSAADGDRCAPGDTLGTLVGPRAAVLRVERTLLNTVGRLCGVATRTDAFVRVLRDGGGRAQLWDTRKTTPGLRLLEKYAGRCGGGMNHRLGLHDAVMLKDNHVSGGAGIAERVGLMLDGIDASVRTGAPKPRFVEVEVDGLEQLHGLLRAHGGRIDAVLLDNMTIDQLCEAVRMRDAAGVSLQLEASGGVNLDTIGAIGVTGVDRVSVGSLTHGARSLDVGLDAEG
ncbi:MAG: carboxylating nicotinate-nucleotide diphosphorylase [Planctomycetota bacterium]